MLCFQQARNAWTFAPPDVLNEPLTHDAEYVCCTFQRQPEALSLSLAFHLIGTGYLELPC